MEDSNSEINIQKKENNLEKRKKKIINWFNDPHNLILTLIIVFAFLIRLRYFNLVGNQPIWWDEAEYMTMARAWAFGLDYQFIPVRAILLSLITVPLLYLPGHEFLLRIFLFGLSIGSIIAIYYLGKETFNKNVGLISAFLMSVFYVNLFYTLRLLVDLPSLTFYTLGAFFFYKYIKRKSNKSLYIGAAIIAIGTLFKIPTATFLFAFGIYLLITTKLSFLKRKELWVSGVIFVLILSPYLLWGYLQFDGFVITQAGAWNAPEGSYFENGVGNIKFYASMFPYLLSWPILISLILGLIILLDFILGFDILLTGKNRALNRNLFLVLIFLVPIITVSFSLGNMPEDRYILNAFPAAFIIASVFIQKIYYLIKKHNKLIAMLFIIILLSYFAYFQLKSADALIKNKQQSYGEIKQAGLWLKENTELTEAIISQSKFQIEYYSERTTKLFQASEEELDSLIAADENIRYLMVSAIQRSPDWTYNYPQKNNLTVVQAYFFDQNQQQPSLIIYKLSKPLPYSNLNMSRIDNHTL